jgi:hypothetical protein
LLFKFFVKPLTLFTHVNTSSLCLFIISFLLTGVHFLFYMQPFLYNAVHRSYSPRKHKITEACAVIFNSVAKFGTITKFSAAIQAQRVAHVHQKASKLYADNAVL